MEPVVDDGISTSPTRAEPPRRSVRGRRSNRLLKSVRRVHMYTGLLMFPWVLIFGVSGLLFNHPNVGEKVVGGRLGPIEVEELTGVSPWRPELAAEALVAHLNRSSSRESFTLDSNYRPEFHGVTLFRADAPEGRNLLVFDVEQGAGILSTRFARQSVDPPPFAESEVHLEEFSISDLESRFGSLLEARGVETLRPLAAHNAIGPTLRLRIRDHNGDRWNVTHNLRSGEVGGRRTDQRSDIGFNQLLGMLHKTHHYTMRPGPLWLWALFEDLLGLTLILWALSGLMMWWQIKPARTIGAVAIVITLALGGVVILGTVEDVTFGEVKHKLSP